MPIEIRTSLEEPETRPAFVPHRPAAPGQGGGRQAVRARLRLPAGRRPAAGDRRAGRAGARRTRSTQVLLGVTGSGKTFTMAKVIEALQRPALVLAPNKILAAQLYGEFKSFFPDNAVEYFVSYYDYYQPEAYVPALRHLHREGKLGERGDRPDAPLGDPVAARARRRDHRRLGLLHLRHRLGRDLFGDDLRPQEGPDASTSARSSASSSRSSTSATTRPSRAAISGCAATISRSSPRTMRTWPGGSPSSATRSRRSSSSIR